jgi:hypothetical protein
MRPQKPVGSHQYKSNVTFWGMRFSALCGAALYVHLLDWMVFISHFVHVFILEITLGESGVQPKVIHVRTLAHKEKEAKNFFERVKI